MEELQTLKYSVIKEGSILETVTQQSVESIIITDKYGNIEYVNPAFEKISGYSKEEAIRKNISFLKSGKQDEEFYKNLWNTIKNKQVWEGNIINKKGNGELYELEASISPICDISGNITHYVSLRRDITEEKNLARQLRQSQKMETIGTLAGGIAHDFNNILGGIIGFTELTLMQRPDDELIKKNLSQVIKAGQRAKELIKQILTFSRQTEQKRSLIKLSVIIKEVIKLLRASIPSTIEIQEHISETSTILADPTQMHQIIVNLCANSSYAMKDNGGILEISLTKIEISKEDLLLYNNLKPGPYIRLSISDTGCGIEKELLGRIFEPYFTTKTTGEGTGMGLAVVHGIVKSHNGDIRVYSEPGKGTDFHIYLPRIKTEVKSENNEVEKPPEGKERILVVDDEKDIAELNECMLNSLGYKVTSRTNSLDALELFKKNPDRFDIIVTDYTMPGMTGIELAEKIHNIRADIPIVLSTGFAEDITLDEMNDCGIKDLLKKPFTIIELARSVRKNLEIKSCRINPTKE